MIRRGVNGPRPMIPPIVIRIIGENPTVAAPGARRSRSAIRQIVGSPRSRTFRWEVHESQSCRRVESRHMRIRPISNVPLTEVKLCAATRVLRRGNCPSIVTVPLITHAFAARIGGGCVVSPELTMIGIRSLTTSPPQQRSAPLPGSTRSNRNWPMASEYATRGAHPDES